MARFYCASFGQGSTAFIFHGNPRVWDGKMLRKTVRGNSVLYILLEDDQVYSCHITQCGRINDEKKCIYIYIIIY